jgi:hypothetical protein
MVSDGGFDRREGLIDAQSLIEALQRYQSLIPDYTQLTNAEIIALRKAATLAPEWIEAAVYAVGASTAVEVAVGVTGEQLREEIADVNRWTGVEQELRALLKGVAAANLIRRHRIGLKALQVYGISRQLVRQPEHMNLIAVVDKMKQMNKLGRRKPKAEPENPASS